MMHNKFIIFMITLATAWAAPQGIPNSYNALVKDQFLTTACKADDISPPLSNGTTALPDPPYGQKVLHLAVGRGTQNYTCDSSSSSTAPKAVGALAILYNALCVAINNPDLFNLLPDISLQFSTPGDVSGPVSPSSILNYQNLNIIGHHFFSNSTTPVFDLNTPNGMFGNAVMEKTGSVNAPPDAPKGQGSNANGAVPWLLLTSTSASTGPVKTVYRTMTAGGEPPATCNGMPSSFTVEYAAHYWFLG
jgi:hypothetical protein